MNWQSLFSRGRADEETAPSAYAYKIGEFMENVSLPKEEEITRMMPDEDSQAYQYCQQFRHRKRGSDSF